ncbi:MAG: LysM peptidoglycan-binding domain-containing protein [Bacillota bacterium]
MSINCPNGQLYVIQAGDTYFSLARRFGIAVDELLEANPGVDPDALFIGQTICIPVPVTPPECPGGFVYEVQAGDTYFSLARRFGTTVSALLAANPGVDPNRLAIGQEICIPVAPPPQPECPGFLYTIRAGDTFFALARRYGTTVAAITAANPGVNPSNLQIGQQICIPTPAPVQCPNGFLYTIAAGDTYFSLAQRYGTSIAAITAANPGVNPNNLQIGQQICIPVAPPSPVCAGGFFYTIQAGDTYFSIAQRFNTTVQALITANPGVDPNRLVIGDQICIPVPPPAGMMEEQPMS